MDILVGSNYFFSKFPDFKSKDKDIIALQNCRLPVPCLNMKKDGEDVFFYSKMTKEEWIENTNLVPMKVGKFLVPEFCEAIGFTIEDLKIFKNLVNQLDDAHSYEKIIYDAYLKNGKLELTDEQLNRAYKEYKIKRNE